jgi:integrase
MGKLTPVTIKATRHDPAKGKSPQLFPDGQNLYLQVSATGTKSWLFRYSRQGKERVMGLGAFGNPPDGVPLAQARQLAAEARAVLARGLDPIDERKQQQAAAQSAALQRQQNTFEAIAREFVKRQQPGWKSQKHAEQWLSTLEQYAFPIIGSVPVASIDNAQVLAVLNPIWARIPETAQRVRQRIEAVLNHARALGLRPSQLANPATWKGNLDATLPARRRIKPVKHRSALPWQQMPDFMQALAMHDGIGAKVLAFIILTASRTGAVRLMCWYEIDLAARVWTAPAENMKAKKTHRTPLPQAAIDLLLAVQPLARSPADLVFPSPKSGRPLSDMTLSMLVRGMATDKLPDGAPPRWKDIDGRAIVPHGFRSTFKDWSMAHGWQDALSEKALAHQDDNAVRAAYARDDLLDQRRPLMEAWAAHCCP